MNDAAALEAMKDFMGKGWRFEIRAGGPLLWEVDAVGKGLAHWHGCGATFGDAASIALDGATRMEDDVFKVIESCLDKVGKLLRECFGKPVSWSIGPAESVEFGPMKILVSVDVAEGTTPQEHVDREAEFQSRAIRELPEAFWKAMHVEARWGELKIGRGPGGEARLMEEGEPARSAGAPLSIAGIVWEGIRRMEGERTTRVEIRHGDAVSLVERMPTGTVRARIDRRLAPIALGEIRDLGNLAMVEQDEDGTMLVRVSPEWRPAGGPRTLELIKKTLAGMSTEEIRIAKQVFDDAYRWKDPEGPPRSGGAKIQPFPAVVFQKLSDIDRELVTRWIQETSSTVNQKIARLIEQAQGGTPIPNPARSAGAKSEEAVSGGDPTTLGGDDETGGRMKQDPARSADAGAPRYFTKGPLLDPETPAAAPMTEDPSRRLGAKNSWDRATHERLTAAVDDLVRGATMGAETDEEITGHLPTAALVAMDPQAIQDLIAWVRRARGTPAMKEDPARSAGAETTGSPTLDRTLQKRRERGAEDAASAPMTKDPARSAGGGSPISTPFGPPEEPPIRLQDMERGSGGDAAAPGSPMTGDPGRRPGANPGSGKSIAPRAQVSILTTSPSAAPDPDAPSEVPSREENKVGDEDYVAARTLCAAVERFLISSAAGGRDAFAVENLQAVFDATKNILTGGGR